MAGHLSDAQLQHYRLKGCCFPNGVIDRSEALAIRRQIEKHEVEHGASLQTYLRENPHYVLCCIDRLIRNEAILDAVESVIGPDILVWASAFFIKEARSASFVSWHQDARYWGLEPHDGVTAWIALGDSRPENGCMRFVPGSHLFEVLEHDDTHARDNILSRGQQVADVDDSAAVDVVLEAGQMSLHHMRVVHGSRPNRSEERRMGLAVNYMPAHVRQTTGPDCAMLVRGVDRYGHFEPGRSPAADMEPDALDFYHRVTDRQMEILHRGAAKGREASPGKQSRNQARGDRS